MQIAAQGVALGNQIAAQGMAHDVVLAKIANSSATVGVHALLEVPGPGGILPSAAAPVVWFPPTVFDLQGMSGVRGESSCVFSSALTCGNFVVIVTYLQQRNSRTCSTRRPGFAAAALYNFYAIPGAMPQAVGARRVAVAQFIGVRGPIV